MADPYDYLARHPSTKIAFSNGDKREDSLDEPKNNITDALERREKSLCITGCIHPVDKLRYEQRRQDQDHRSLYP